MKCFICGNFSQTMPTQNKITSKSFRKNLKNFCTKMYEDFVKAKQPDVCVSCQKVVQKSSCFKKMVLNSRNVITKTWFENVRNKIDLIDMFGDLDPDENQLNHVYNIKDESYSQPEPMEDITQNSSHGSRSGNVMDLEAIFCVNDPSTMARVNYYKEQEQAKQKEIAERENIPKSPTKLPAARRQRSKSLSYTTALVHNCKEQEQAQQTEVADRKNIPKTPKKLPAPRRQRSMSVSKAKCKALNTTKRKMVCSLCSDILIDAKILRHHIGIHAK